MKSTQRRLSWSTLDHHAYSNWWGHDAFHSPTVPAQLFPVKWFRHENPVLLLENISHRFGGSQKSYMFFSTFSATTDCYLTHDHILFEHKKATEHSLPSPINSLLNESSLRRWYVKQARSKTNKQSVGTQDCRQQFSNGKKGGHESETSNISLNGRRRPLDVVALTGSDSWKHLKIIFLKLWIH